MAVEVPLVVVLLMRTSNVPAGSIGTVKVSDESPLKRK